MKSFFEHLLLIWNLFFAVPIYTISSLVMLFCIFKFLCHTPDPVSSLLSINFNDFNNNHHHF